jgi:hypothetical protein
MAWALEKKQRVKNRKQRGKTFLIGLQALETKHFNIIFLPYPRQKNSRESFLTYWSLFQPSWRDSIFKLPFYCILCQDIFEIASEPGPFRQLQE